ncbi:transposase family protein [Streptomyces cadmiisoli]|uniref:transposase family protein n=1 Tax=Streptomyces cadmiisoli TaxID=2184053 RepID=UPI0036577924
MAAACGPPPRCPGCHALARRARSSYERELAERPLVGEKLQVKLRVRRFFCDRTSCRRKTYVEQAGGRTLSPLQSRFEEVAPRGRGRVRRPAW